MRFLEASIPLASISSTRGLSSRFSDSGSAARGCGSAGSDTLVTASSFLGARRRWRARLSGRSHTSSRVGGEATSVDRLAPTDGHGTRGLALVARGDDSSRLTSAARSQDRPRWSQGEDSLTASSTATCDATGAGVAVRTGGRCRDELTPTRARYRPRRAPRAARVGIGAAWRFAREAVVRAPPR